MKHQVSHKVCTFDVYSTACDEIADATHSPGSLNFLQGGDDNFCFTEKILDLWSLKGTIAAKNILKIVSDTID